MAKIVIIDDILVLARMYATRLNSEGYETQVFTNGQEGLDYIKKNKPDLVLLDVMIPGLDGEGILEDLRSQEAFKNLPIIIFSNISDPAKKDLLLQKGATEFINKADATPTGVVENIKKYLT